MLLTTCPNCQAQFKVSTEQLNVRSGRVMCGRCRNVFNAFESLERHDSTFGAPPDDEPSLGPPSGHPGDLHFARSEDLPEEAPLLDVESTPHTGNPAAETAIDIEEPPSVAPYRFTSSPAAPAAPVASRAWRPLAILAGVALLLQATYLWRSDLIAHYPPLRHYLAQACDHLGCSLPWGRDHAALNVEASDLIEELGGNGRFLLSVGIANRSDAIQDFPHLELSLTDTNNQTLVRRVLAPADYLGRPMQRGEGMAAKSTTQVNVKLETPTTVAAGYHVELFFP